MVDKHLKDIFEQQIPEKQGIVQEIYNLNVDNRIFNQMKRAMNETIQQEQGSLPTKDFKHLFMTCFKHDPVRGEKIYNMMLPHVRVDENNMNPCKLADFIDFFNYTAIQAHKFKRHKNDSQMIH